MACINLNQLGASKPCNDANWNENFRPLACGVRLGSERGLYRKNRPSCLQLLDAVGRTKSVSVAFQGIDIAQNFEWRTVELQIVRCETGNRLQTLDVPQREPMPIEGDQFVPTESLKDPVRVHRNQTQGI